jgi:hypothetical protein
LSLKYLERGRKAAFQHLMSPKPQLAQAPRQTVIGSFLESTTAFVQHRKYQKNNRIQIALSSVGTA